MSGKTSGRPPSSHMPTRNRLGSVPGDVPSGSLATRGGITAAAASSRCNW
nr:MAG TPA: hypothetical protein [Caudoviricetes sp.]